MTRRKAFYLLCIAFFMLFVLFPEHSLSGAQTGLHAFLNAVLPALLPFYVGTTILIKSGVARRISNQFSFLMRPLFDLPGESAFAFTMAAASGYPLGARLTGQLYEEGALSRNAVTGTAILSSCCGPSFMLGAIASGMLRCPQAGMVLAASHYLAMVTVAVISRLFRPRTSGTRSITKPHTIESSSLGDLALDAIASSAVSLWSVGSYMIFFSALISVLNSLGVFAFLSRLFAPAFQILGIPDSAVPAILRGMVEMTDGCSAAATALIPMEAKVLCCCVIITFGGFSVMGQSYYYLRKTGMRFSILLLAKGSAAILSLLYASALLMLLPLPIEAAASVLHFEQILGGNAVLLVIGTLFLSFLGAAMSLYNMRNQK